MAKKSSKGTKARLARALDLKLRGLNDTEISQRMSNEDFKACSARTITRILSEANDPDIVEELKRQQLRDITTADIALRLKWRSDILHTLIPQKIESKIEGATDVRIVIEDGNPQLETPPRTEDDLAK